MASRNLVQRTAGLRKLSCREWEPRDERDVVRLRVFEKGLRLARGEIEHVLHRHDRGEFLRRFQLGDCHLAQAQVPDLALGLQCHELPELVFQRDLRVDAVQLQKVDPLNAQVAKVELDLLTKVFGTPHRNPLVRSLTRKPHLGRDDQVIRVRVKSLADEVVGHKRTVGVGGVDEVDAQLDGTSQYTNCVLGIPRGTPHAGARELHHAIAQSVNRKVRSNGECSGGLC